MTAMTVLGSGGPFTPADLETMPDDGRRYEVLDGLLLVTPPPGLDHQWVLHQMYELLVAGCPRELFVIGGFGYRAERSTEVVPDLLVARRSDVTQRCLPAAPALVVEVRSPSTARVDRTLERDVYESRGVPSYWLVDPRQPSVTVLELRDGRYEQVALAAGDQELAVARPFSVRLRPADLLAGLPGGQGNDAVG